MSIAPRLHHLRYGGLLSRRVRKTRKAGLPSSVRLTGLLLLGGTMTAASWGAPAGPAFSPLPREVHTESLSAVRSAIVLVPEATPKTSLPPAV